MPTRLEFSLFLLRIGVFAVMFTWTLDKFLHPEHTARVFEKFYYFEGIDAQAATVIGGIQMALIGAFLLGLFKRISYGSVVIMHGFSTASTWQYLIDPYQSNGAIMFMTAIPMLMACFALFIMKDQDRFLTLSR